MYYIYIYSILYIYILIVIIFNIYFYFKKMNLDTPQVLFDKKDSIFNGMCVAAGINSINVTSSYDSNSPISSSSINIASKDETSGGLTSTI